MRIQTKLILGILPILVIGFSALGLWSYNTAKDLIHADALRYVETVLEARYDQALLRRTELLRTTKMDQVTSFVSLYQQEALNELKVGSDSQFGCFLIFDQQQNPLFSSANCPAELTVFPLPSVIDKALDRALDKTPVLLSEKNGYVLGSRYFEPWHWTLVYVIKTNSIANATNRILAMTASLAGLSALACALIIIFVFRRVIGLPIVRLKAAAELITKREPNVLIAIDSTDELGDLATSLNAMSIAISSYVNQLQQLASDLERSNTDMKLEILAREHAQNELKSAHDKIEATLKAIPELFFEVDEQGLVYDYHSPDSHDSYAQPKQFLGKTLDEILPKEAADTITEALNKAARNGWDKGTIYQLEAPYQLDAQSGRSWFELSIVQKGAKENLNKRFIVVAHDITALMLADELLRQSEESLKRATISGNVGLWDWDFKTGQVFFSPIWKRQIGYEEHELSGRYEEWESRLHPDDLAHTVATVNKARVAPWPHYKVEFRLRHKDGSYRWILSEGALEFDKHGQPARMRGSHIDITDRKQAEQQKEQLEAQLHQAQKMESVGRLAGGVAHDFNNMLGVILGYTDLLLSSGDFPAEHRSSIEEIRDAGKRSAELTRQLLAFARKQAIIPKVIDLNETLTGMRKMLQRMIGEDITLSWQPQPGLWLVKMDPSQIDQILANLCVNARDAITDVGQITITVDNFSCRQPDSQHHRCQQEQGFADEALAPGDYLRLSMSDNGHGITKEDLPRVFEPFFTTKNVSSGTGLGLATVYGIVKQNRGYIDIISELNEGTTFTIYLPRYVGADEQPQTTIAEETRLSGKGTILLVEDEMALLDMTKCILEKQGYRVLPAATAHQALGLANRHAGEIDLLITDVVMPEMNGRDLAEKLQAACPSLKCLYMSGYTSTVIAQHGVLDEQVNFIQKPFSIAQLSAKVLDVLGHS